MNKILSVLLAVLILSRAFCLNASAVAAESVEVYVTISDKGTLKVAAEKISVADKNEDGTITIDEALVAAHDKFYEGGAAAGFSAGASAYGFSVFKLWGDTSGNFGYYLNNASSWSPADAVADGDYVVAFIYSDTDSWSDTYTFFDKNQLDVESGEEITLVLKEAGFDQNWNPVVDALKNTTITINNEATEYKTDSEGKVTFKFDKGGKYIISAKSAEKVIVPPACVITVHVEEEDIQDKTQQESEKAEETTPQETESSPKTKDSINHYIVIALIALAVVTITFKKNDLYEE